MTPLNPLTGAALQSQLLQRPRSAAKNQQIRKSQVLARNVAATDDTYEHTVESTDRVDPSHDQDPRKNPQQQQQEQRDHPKPESETTEEEPPHLDLTA